MFAAVHLNNQLAFTASKICVIGTNWLLAHEFEAFQLTVAQASPQKKFLLRWCAPEGAWALGSVFVLAAHLPLTPALSPLMRGEGEPCPAPTARSKRWPGFWEGRLAWVLRRGAGEAVSPVPNRVEF